MMKLVEMGKLLAQSRRMLRYSQENVAEIIGVSDRTIRNIEYGLTSPELNTVLRLWDLYGLSPDLLFFFYNRTEEMEAAIRFYNEKKVTVPV